MSHLLASLLIEYPNYFLKIGSFLDKLSLVFLEQACSLNPRVLDHLWQTLAAQVFATSAIWRSANRAMDDLPNQSTSGKLILRALDTLKRTLSPPEAWRPWISQTSACSLTVNPFLQDRTDLNLPFQASVPVRVGAFPGQSLVVGVSIWTKETLQDNVCVGFDAMNDQSITSIMLAPMSGHCFLQNRVNGFTMRTAALPALDVVPESLRVWIQLTEEGAVRFLRQVENCKPEDAGTIGPEWFPCWIEEYYACLHFWGNTLKAAASVSIDHAQNSFPSWFVDKSSTEMDSVWEPLSVENW